MTPADDHAVISFLRRIHCTEALAGAPDEELLEQFVAHRDDAAFTVLLRRHGPMVWGVCRRLVADRQDAEDCFQATFLVLSRKAASIGRGKLLANWLFGVARRAALNARAMRARRAEHEQLCEYPPDARGTTPTLWDDVRSVLDEELAKLPRKYRLPLLLCGLEGMTHAEAGKHLGWPTGTVAGRSSRGRELLRTRLMRRGILAPAAALSAWLTAEAAQAGVPAQLAAASVRTALASLMAGRSTSACVPTAVATLVHGVLGQMVLRRLLETTAILVAASTAMLGAAAGIWQATRSVETKSVASVGPAAGAPSSVPPRNNFPRAFQGRTNIWLPANPGAVVLRMDRSVDSSKAATSLRVHADGRVVAELPEGLASLSAQQLTRYAQSHAAAQGPDRERESPKVKVLEGKLTASELEELLRFAIEDQDFFACDRAAVMDEIRDKYHSDGIVLDNTDATTIDFRIQTADRNHEVRWSRLAKASWDFPEVQRLRHLRGVEMRLTHVFYVLLAGGPERVEAVVAKMDQLLKSYYLGHPTVPRLTAADLCEVVPASDNACPRFSFARYDRNFDFKPLFAASIEVPQRGEPTLYSLIPPQ